MRSGNQESFFVVEPDNVNIRTMDGEHRLVRILAAVLCYRERPGAAKVERPRHNDVALLISAATMRTPSAPILRVDHNLRIKLASRERKQWTRGVPRESVVSADQQGNRRGRTGWALGHGAVLRIENVNVPVGVSSHSRFPLIAFAVTQTIWGR